MTIKVTFRCWDCPKHTGENGEFDNLNEALEHMQKFPNHILYLKVEVENDEDN